LLRRGSAFTGVVSTSTMKSVRRDVEAELKLADGALDGRKVRAAGTPRLLDRPWMSCERERVQDKLRKWIEKALVINEPIYSNRKLGSIQARCVQKVRARACVRAWWTGERGGTGAWSTPAP
jgi:hypothetical protein